MEWARRSPGFSRGGRIPLQTGLEHIYIMLFDVSTVIIIVVEYSTAEGDEDHVKFS
jgi:hypothetical protein